MVSLTSATVACSDEKEIKRKTYICSLSKGNNYFTNILCNFGASKMDDGRMQKHLCVHYNYQTYFSA